MVAWSEIERYCDAIAREFKPQRIIVFGSYAYGSPTSDSDVDVMVIMRSPKRRGLRQSLEIRRRVSAGFPVDILVRAPSDVSMRIRAGDSLIWEVMTKGKVVYEAEHA